MNQLISVGAGLAIGALLGSVTIKGRSKRTQHSDSSAWWEGRSLENDTDCEALVGSAWFSLADLARLLQGRDFPRKPSGAAWRDARRLLSRWEQAGQIEQDEWTPGRIAFRLRHA